jgi:hypothetical protein
VPCHDETYRDLGNSLFVHARIPNMSLLRFKTFDGLEAFQPCCRDIDILNLQKSLRHIETGDPVFSAARDWSCILQALPGLPKEVRWVLATIYNFACVMLRLDNDEDSHWAMRPWLVHWYDVADSLFLKYDIPAVAPDPDWFSRPVVSLRNPTRLAQHSSPAYGYQSQSVGAVFDHPTPISSLVHDSEEDDSALDLIDICVSRPPTTIGFRNGRLFDPTPGGQIISQREPLMSVGSGSVMRLSCSLDPSSPAYVPLLQDDDTGRERWFHSISNDY